jgi:hypothetical protein
MQNVARPAQLRGGESSDVSRFPIGIDRCDDKALSEHIAPRRHDQPLLEPVDVAPQ